MTTLEPGLQLTERAAARIKLIAADGSQVMRVAVNGGGCSGFQYEFTLDKNQDADDVVTELNGAAVVVDPVSMNYLKGSVLDFVDDLMGQSFRVQNPQAKSSCGCGTSFSL